jgi:hypothetical protein
VVLFLGRNKIVPTLDDAMQRIKNYAAPANAIRHPGLKTPCAPKPPRAPTAKARTASATPGASPKNAFPEGRIKVILINQDLGL